MIPFLLVATGLSLAYFGILGLGIVIGSLVVVPIAIGAAMGGMMGGGE